MLRNSSYSAAKADLGCCPPGLMHSARPEGKEGRGGQEKRMPCYGQYLAFWPVKYKDGGKKRLGMKWELKNQREQMALFRTQIGHNLLYLQNP